MVVRNVGMALCDAHPGGNERQNNRRPPPSRRGVSCPATCPGALEGGQLQQPHGATDPLHAVTLALALLGAGEGLNTGLAWLYVGLWVAHNLIQAIINVSCSALGTIFASRIFAGSATSFVAILALRA